MNAKTELKHTPTPWKEQGLAIRDADGDLICDVYVGGINSTQNEANRAFIVRAVNSHDELLELLKESMTRCTKDLRNKCEAAIQKAEARP